MRCQVDLGDEHGWCGRVDFVDPSPAFGRRRGLIEVQSERYHSALVDVRADSVRLARLQAAGFVVGTVEDFQVWHRRAEVVAEVRRIRAETNRSGWVSTAPTSGGATQNAV